MKTDENLINPIFSLLECGCNTEGATSNECDTTGKCYCKGGFTGDKCDGYLSLSDDGKSSEKKGPGMDKKQVHLQ